MTLILCWLVAFSNVAFDIAYVRNTFYLSLNNKSECKNLRKYFATNPPEHNAVALAYDAANMAMHAQFVDGPYDKCK